MYTIEPFNMKCNEQDCLNFYTPEINKVRAPNIVFNQEFLSDGQKYHVHYLVKLNLCSCRRLMMADWGHCVD